MLTVESIVWQIFDNPPTHQDRILIQLDDGTVHAGYCLDGKRYYLDFNGVECNVVWWAEWPKGVSDG
jgi:hypothetical protein